MKLFLTGIAALFLATGYALATQAHPDAAASLHARGYRDPPSRLARGLVGDPGPH
jgi:hypothetical protein